MRTCGGTLALAVLILLSLGGSRAVAEDETCEPCAELVHPCKRGTTDPDKAEKRIAEYSPECAAYLRQCTSGAWFYRAGEEAAALFTDRNVDRWLPNGVGNGANRAAVVNRKGRVLRALYASTEAAARVPHGGAAPVRSSGTPLGPPVDPRYAKSIGVGFRNHTYLGVYNCQTEFQQAHAETGCPLFTNLKPFTRERTYIGIVRNNDPTAPECLAVQPTLEGGDDDVWALAQDDFKIACLPKVNRNTGCAFEVWPWTSVVAPLRDWGYVCTQIQPDNSFDPGSRPWYIQGRDAMAAGAPSGVAIYRPPYVNYGTGEAIFGTVTPFTDVTGEIGGVVLSIEYMEDEPTYQHYVPECDAASPSFDPTYTYEYEPLS